MKTMTFVVLFAIILSACAPAPAPTATPVPPTATVPPPTPVPPTATVPAPTATVPPPTATIAPAPVFVASLKGDAYQFGYPVAVAVDAQDNLYVADGKTLLVKKFDANGKFITQWGGHDGDFKFQDENGYWGCLAIDAEGQVYVSDGGNYRIHKFDANGHFLAAWGSEGEGDGQFKGSCAGVDSQGNVYVSDPGLDRVQKFDPNGKFLLKWGSRGAEAGQFDDPWTIVGDPEGNVYVTDNMNSRFQEFDANGKFVAEFDLPLIKNSHVGPIGMARDSQGAFYIVDNSIYNRVVKVDSHGALITWWGSMGSGDGQFMGAEAIAVDSRGYIYVADTLNGRVQKFRQP